jgi:hypothetical protein
MKASSERECVDPLSTLETIEQFRRYLADTSRCRVELMATRNRVSMISVQFRREGYVRVRLHEQFLVAPAPVREALALYLRTRHRGAWTLVADYARRIRVPAGESRRPAHRLQTCGQVHDLREIADEVNSRFFNGMVTCDIGWGARRPRSRRRSRSRSIRYGSWSHTTRTVRIHPLLDDRRVPRAFVAYILYHEMLHVVVPSEVRTGRRIDHSVAFRQLESRYPDIEDMRRLSRSLLNTLLD